MIYDIVIFTMIVLAFALIIIWLTSQSMIENKDLFGFCSFLLLGISLTFYVVLIALEVFLSWAWMFLELMIFVSLVWIYVNIVEANRNG